MKKIFLFLYCILLPLYGYAQKSLFVGTYATADNVDTAIRVFMSYDSVRMISSVPKRNNDMWLQVKCGKWKIKSGKENESYIVTFLFNDGTSQDLAFYPTYLEKNALPPPDHYVLRMGHTTLDKLFGKNSSIERFIAPLKQQNNNDDTHK